MATARNSISVAVMSAIQLPSRENRVGGCAAGRGTSIAPALRIGTVASSRPSASMTAEMPVGVARMMGMPSSIARSCAWARCWGGPQVPNQLSLEGLKISAVVDGRGALLNALPWRQPGVIDTELPRPVRSVSLFARLGNIIPLALGFLLLIAAIALDRRRRYRKT